MLLQFMTDIKSLNAIELSLNAIELWPCVLIFFYKVSLCFTSIKHLSSRGT